MGEAVYNRGMRRMEVDGVLVAAHELKEPLAVLRQLAFALPEMGSSGEQIRREMVDVSERAMRQVNDLTRIHRLEREGCEMEPVAVRVVCDEATNEVVRLFDERKQKITVSYRNRAKLVTANRDLLRSVIFNFLTNAIHYADKETETQMSVMDTGGLVRVAVRDYGPALPTDVWREMRRGFLEQPTSIAMRPGSSGLGLYIASRFSRAMRARVGAVRHRDGTSFYVEVPVSKQMSLI